MRKFINILAVCLAAMGGILFVMALMEKQPYEKAQAEQEVLQKAMILNVNQGQKENPLEREIDFISLQKINKDIAAWIYIPGTHIDYPVLIGKTNSQYLNQNFRGAKSKLGSVFAFSDTSRDFADAHVCLFAHNTSSGQMFGDLKKYKEEDFAKNNAALYCYTPEGVTKYTLFSVYECEKTDSTFEHKMQKNSRDFFDFFKRAMYKNKFKENAKSTEIQADNRQIISLSCCSDYKRTINRLTVHFMENR